jgi:hypothetical protein
MLRKLRSSLMAVRNLCTHHQKPAKSTSRRSPRIPLFGVSSLTSSIRYLFPSSIVGYCGLFRPIRASNSMSQALEGASGLHIPRALKTGIPERVSGVRIPPSPAVDSLDPRK